MLLVQSTIIDLSASQMSAINNIAKILSIGFMQIMSKFISPNQTVFLPENSSKKTLSLHKKFSMFLKGKMGD